MMFTNLICCGIGHGENFTNLSPNLFFGDTFYIEDFRKLKHVENIAIKRLILERLALGVESFGKNVHLSPILCCGSDYDVSQMPALLASAHKQSGSDRPSEANYTAKSGADQRSGDGIKWHWVFLLEALGVFVFSSVIKWALRLYSISSAQLQRMTNDGQAEIPISVVHRYFQKKLDALCALQRTIELQRFCKMRKRINRRPNHQAMHRNLSSAGRLYQLKDARKVRDLLVRGRIGAEDALLWLKRALFPGDDARLLRQDVLGLFRERERSLGVKLQSNSLNTRNRVSPEWAEGLTGSTQSESSSGFLFFRLF